MNLIKPLKEQAKYAHCNSFSTWGRFLHRDKSPWSIFPNDFFGIYCIFPSDFSKNLHFLPHWGNYPCIFFGTFAMAVNSTVVAKRIVATLSPLSTSNLVAIATIFVVGLLRHVPQSTNRRSRYMQKVQARTMTS